MASLVLAGDTSGSITVSAPAVAGSTTQTLVNVTGTLAPIVSGTAVTASGTSVDFTNIPSWVKRITIALNRVSTTGAGIQFRLGTGGSPTTSGYLGSGGVADSGSSTSVTQYTTGAALLTQAGATMNGLVTCVHLGSNLWVISGSLGYSGNNYIGVVGSSVTLGGVLDMVRITTVNGTDTFDAGTINLLWE